jgi:hypothetical protein
MLQRAWRAGRRSSQRRPPPPTPPPCRPALEGYRAHRGIGGTSGDGQQPATSQGTLAVRFWVSTTTYSAWHGESNDLVARSNVADAGPDLRYDSCEVGALARGKCRRPAAMQHSFPNLCLAGIDRCCIDPHQRLLRAGSGMGTSATRRTSMPPYLSKPYCLS